MSNEKSTNTHPIINAIVKRFQQQLRKSHIPILTTIAKETTLSRYMLNRKLYLDILGDNIFITDGFLRNAIAEEVICFLKEMNDTYQFPGVWDYDISTVAFLSVNILSSVDDENKMYLSSESIGVAPIDADYEGHYPEDMLMEFAEYNPARLEQMVAKMRTTALNIIIHEVAEHYPLMYVRTPMDDPDSRLVALFQHYIGNPLTSINMRDRLGNDPTEKEITVFVDAIEKPFLRYVNLLMINSGISDRLIASMFETMQLHVLYSNKDVAYKDVPISYALTFPEVKVEGNDGAIVRIPFEFTVKEFVDIAYSGEDCEGLSKTKKKQFASKVKVFSTQLCQIATAISVGRYQKQ